MNTFYQPCQGLRLFQTYGYTCSIFVFSHGRILKLVYLSSDLQYTRMGWDSFLFAFPGVVLELKFVVCLRLAGSGWFTECAH